jgi:hypothetical protein
MFHLYSNWPQRLGVALCALLLVAAAAPARAQLSVRELGLRVTADGSSAIQVMGNSTQIQVWVYKAQPNDTDVADQGSHWFRAHHVKTLGHDHLFNVPGLKKQYLLRVSSQAHNRVHGMSVFTRDITPTMPPCSLVAGTYTVVATGAPVPNTPNRPVFVQLGPHIPRGLHGNLITAQHAIEGTRPPAELEVTPGVGWDANSTGAPPATPPSEHFPPDTPRQPEGEPQDAAPHPDEFGGGGTATDW